MTCDYRKSPDFAIDRTAHLLRTTTQSLLHGVGWIPTPEETQIMLALSMTEGALNVDELATLLTRDRMTVQRQLDWLATNNLVRRESGDDGVVSARLSDWGTRELERVQPLLAQSRGEALKDISPADVQTTVATLLKMQVNLSDEHD